MQKRLFIVFVPTVLIVILGTLFFVLQVKNKESIERSNMAKGINSTAVTPKHGECLGEGEVVEYAPQNWGNMHTATVTVSVVASCKVPLSLHTLL